MNNARNIKLTLQYDGTDYSGWQVQKNGTTIQGLLNDAVFSVTGEHSRVTGAARTDAGVHALEQVASFSTGSGLETQTLVRALNANLPYDIRVVNAEECDADFHPRYDAGNKTYSYIITHTGAYSVFLKRYSWNMPYKLNSDEMREAAQYLAGTHDFACFRASGCSSKHPVRTIHRIEINGSPSIGFIGFQFNAPIIKISITANAFLRHMARNIAGTLVEIGRGKSKPGRMKEILESKDRSLAGKTAPACGLFLEQIYYQAE
ncbi:MAG: tRNA pseudouridine(38-40) synthase TruA [Nitrospiraceae bacterium]|nr:MAG: tRNA pseudouridine(38-40) synthase TruA [Nitrospiraceae bacterium]